MTAEILEVGDEIGQQQRRCLTHWSSARSVDPLHPPTPQHWFLVAGHLLGAPLAGIGEQQQQQQQTFTGHTPRPGPS